MRIDKKLLIRLLMFGGYLIPVVLVLSFLSSRKEKKLSSCSFFTIMEPRNMSSYNYMNYDFFYNFKRYSASGTVSSLDLGLSYSPSNAMSRRYFIQVHCKDFKTKQVLWKIPVPDTLKYIPPKGWKKIPYGLKEESVWFKRWRK